MALFKCKMCGGNIEFNPGDSVGTCDSCGSVQTLPKGNDDVITNLFNRANNLRIKSEFDKAAEVYEKILNEDNSNAEAHWGLVLCKYGIEYVEDPATYKRVPTCHRAQYESVMTDADYVAALENADATQQAIYTQQAVEISNIQKGILAIVKDEKPFDVFICYKETDENGKRTVDSALANDIYYQLTREGLKVFYAAITLEDKLGQEYEPYIFAALNSAKVMLVVGTKPEYFEAVWVRNEWSRFIKLMKTDRSKLLIPCYRDMDAYDLPEDFAHLQAQDMAKIGFVNDVVRGIKKVVDSAQPKTETVKETVVVNNNVASSNTNALLERAFMFLEDGKWAEADEYCEKVLDAEPKNAEAYLGKLMAELQIKTKDNLKNVSDPFDGKDNCVKASRFDSAIAEKLKADNEYIRDRNENTRKIGVYNKANTEMKLAKTEEEFKSAAVTFNSIKGFMNSDAKAKECLEKAENARKDAIYDLAISEMKKHKTSDYESAISNFERIIDWKDSRNKINECNKGIEDIRIAEEKAEAERKRKAEEARIAAEKAKEKTKKIAIVVTPIVAAVVVFLIVLNTVILPASNYKKAKEMFKNAKVGDMIIFGTYEQDNKITNGKEAIEWRVLAKEGNKVLIISEKALDCQQYNSSWTDVTWETCTLRKWMNKDFYNSAFNAGEQTIIADTKVTADPNPSYSTNPGNDTTDKVFLLSIDEAYKYFSSVEDRKCVPTAYAISNGADTSSSFTKNGEATCCWWLRSPGGDYGFAAIVNYVGLIGGKGDFADYSDYCVRPALWIEIG